MKNNKTLLKQFSHAEHIKTEVEQNVVLRVSETSGWETEARNK